MSDDYDRIVEKTLLQIAPNLPVFGHDEETAPLSLDQLAELPIAVSLRWIARVARGSETATAAQVFPAIRMLLATVFWPRAMDVQKIRTFYRDDPLGQMLIRAKWQSVADEELMTIEEAAMELHVVAATIWHWIFTDVIEFVHDDTVDRFLVLRSDVARIAANQHAHEIAKQPITRDVETNANRDHTTAIARTIRQDDAEIV